MKSKKIELVLKKTSGYTPRWDLRTTDGIWLDCFCTEEIKKLFRPGKETCMILEITAHPAEWVEVSDD